MAPLPLSERGLDGVNIITATLTECGYSSPRTGLAPTALIETQNVGVRDGRQTALHGARSTSSRLNRETVESLIAAGRIRYRPIGQRWRAVPR